MKDINTHSSGYEILGKLNDLAWHTMQVNRLTADLRYLGISEEGIKEFLKKYDKSMIDAAKTRTRS